ncbi:MAG: adenylosuccinate lyase [Elusimicrobiaceae bacterium]|nr:adenylosuccinate lyase [Elusimicrobiaceae bacterium]
MENFEYLSPLDARYKTALLPLSKICGQNALTKNRLKIETEYFILLSTLGLPNFPKLNKTEINFIKNLQNPTEKDFNLIAALENKGYKNIPATNHDVKAIEYFLRLKFQTHKTLKNKTNWLHFAITSEDTNSPAYALMLAQSLEKEILPTLNILLNNLKTLAKKEAASPCLARTHGQASVPTTFGKEIAVFAARLQKQINNLKTLKPACKFSGAVGNFNAHYAVFPKINWQKVSQNLIKNLNEKHQIKIELSKLSTQIDNHDSFAEIFDNLARINNILIDLAQDFWRYISDGWLKQEIVKGEVGSSTMPQKINPIYFENAEGNFGFANAILKFFSQKLTISRLQRDLSDSTVLRNIPVGLGHCLLGYKSLIKGLSKVTFDSKKALEVLRQNPQILAEYFQTLLRANGMENAYEIIKDLTRTYKFSEEDLSKFLEKQKFNKEIKNKIKQAKVEDYLGIAPLLAKEIK